MKKTLALVILAGILALNAFAGDELPAVKDKSFYTKVNIHYEAPRKILSTNYLKGTLLPVGTKVKIVDINDRQVVFVNASNVTFAVTLVPKHTLVNMAGLFDRLFSETDPLAASGVFGTFTPTEKFNIKKGTVIDGMRKKAVLMAYGYPPESSTPSLDDSTWTYWVARISRTTLHFDGDKLSSIQD
jgi:hypothetical protein